MGNKKYAVMLGVIASFSVISVTYAWTWSTSVGNGDSISADKWNALVTQLISVSVNPDWNATTGYARILNKPTIPAAQVNSDWNAASGVAQILNKPSIPAAQVNSDWNATSGVAQILNKPWTTSGVNQYSANSGNVGIGTGASPATKLEVVGTIRATTVEYGNSQSRTETRDNAGLQGDAGAKSGFFETASPTNYPTGATSWWHLIDVRHNNTANNYALQIGGSFFDQNLYFRKTNNSATTAWNRLITENSSGYVGIGTTSPAAARLNVHTLNGTTALAITTPNNSPWALTIRNNTATTRGIEMYQSNDGSSYIYNGYGGAPQAYIGFATNGSISTTSAITAANLNQAPVISTTNRSTLYTSTTAGRQYMGTSVTFTVPAGPNRTYRIGARIMGHASAAGNYLLYSVSNSSSSLAGIPTGLGYPYEYALDTGRHSNYTEGYVTLAPGTYTYYMFVYGGTSYTINYHYDPAYTNIMVWPM